MKTIEPNSLFKEEILAKLDQGSYNRQQVIDIINQIKVNKATPRVIRKGDVYIDTYGKKRPCVVFKVEGEIAYSLPLSTTKDIMNICESSGCRFLNYSGEQVCYFGRGIITAHVERVKEKFICVYDNPKDLAKAIREMKNSMKQILK